MNSKRVLSTVCLGMGLLLLSLGLIAAMSAPATAAGTTYYVDAASGNDSRTPVQAQNPATPWKSITHAAATVPAGTILDPNIIQVAPGAYTAAGSGEVFPIVFANPNVILLGSGAASTSVDAAGAGDAISVTVPGIAISHLAVQDVINDAIWVGAGGFSVADCAFSDVAVGIDVSIDMALVGPGSYAIEGIEIVRNTFVFTDAGIVGDVSIDGGDTASTIQIGDLDILSNTFEAASLISAGVAWDIFDVEHLIGGQLTLGDVSILSNTFTAGFVGVSFYGTADYLTDTLVTAGDVVISDNVFQDQFSTGIELDYYDAVHWAGTTSGSAGDIVVADNDIACTLPTCSGLAVSDVTYFEYFSDDTTLELGDVTIQGNHVQVDGDGIYVYYNYIDELSGSATITVGQLAVLSNTVSSPSGSAIYVDLEDMGANAAGDSSVSVGSVVVAGNAISNAETGIYAYFYDLGYYTAGDATFSLGAVTVANNEISATYGIDFEYYDIGEEMEGRSTATLGDVVIRDNVINSSDDGIYFYYDYVAYGMYDSAALNMGDVTIADNEVLAGANGVYILPYEYDYATDMEGASSAILPSYIITGNTIDAQSDGVYYYSYSNPDDISGDSRVDFGGFLIADNIFRGNNAGYGIYLEYDDFCEGCYDASSGEIGDIIIRDNTLTDWYYDAIYLYNDDLTYDLGSDAEVIAGEVHVTGNTIDTAGGDGIYVEYYDIESSGSATVTVGAITVMGNDLRNVGEDGISVSQELIASDSSVLDAGPVQVLSNTVEAGDRGITAYMGTDSDSGATLNLGRASIVNNVVGADGMDGLSIDIESLPVDIVHNTIANPTPASSAGISVTTGTVFITNTIVSGYANGINNGGGTVSEDYNLFYVTASDTLGTVASGGHSLSGLNPAFFDPAAMSYQLRIGSPARDSGTAAGVPVDVDGNLRIAPPDIGAYEGQPGTYVPLVMRMY